MDENPVTNREIMWIGAMGGISLAVLKLIEAKFYVGSMLGRTAIVAYCTYLAYIFFGVVVARYFAERSLPNEKCSKSGDNLQFALRRDLNVVFSVRIDRATDY